ncbi:DUF6030 family protein [Agrobacterium pusense]|uniref:DUF6030 family protein n=1 Tax=Agrobacterium pusense TaxID=648995 RepID=UPI00045914C4|nr:DUF6030 family protein [Agrobacterium pusense]AMD61642.1 hypothetical protein AWN88_22020 [Agrobacterium tumefaciens]MBM7326300.1 hypothetical protein [Agrobacterium sp. S2]PZU78245.1 MAG: hypothetical protein DI546_03775 [Rhizobium sp.]KAJ37003.1 hypothetical protein BW45_10180 [Agrobacterium tumefaciens]MRG66550.1 hypothetical protein [Agrobacterium pusense]
MDAGPQKRVSLRALLVAVLVVCFAISATVLLANDKKHLRSLLTYLNLAPAPLSAVPSARAKPVKRQKPAARTIYLPSHLLKFERNGARASFARDFIISGKDLCDRFTAEGFTSPRGWHPSPVNNRSFECMADLGEATTADPADAASLFLEIRGEVSGEIRSVRLKAVAPQTSAGRAVNAKLAAALAMIIEQTRWRDIGSVLEPAQKMQPYQARHFGISASVKPEPTAPHRVNVILLATETSAGLKLTRSFFDRDRWLRPASASDRPTDYRSVKKNRAR